MGPNVDAGQLKKRLCTYLSLVRAGRTFVVTNRGRPVAELCPLSAPEDRIQAILSQMAAEGSVTLPTRKGKPGRFRPLRLRRGPSIAATVSEGRD